jgi:hypothetical protein
VRFEKTPEFPARERAENMARLYNRASPKATPGRRGRPGTQPASYHPDW